MPVGADELEQAARLSDQGCYAEAEQICRRLQQQEPNQSGVLFVLGNALCGLARWHEAVDCFQGVLQSETATPCLLNNLAYAQAGSGDFTAAAASLRQALQLDPGYLKGWRGLAQALLAGKSYHEAVEVLHEALELAPDDVRLLQDLAVACNKDKQYEAALVPLQRLLEIGFEDRADVLARMANLHCYLGEAPTAVRCFDQALAVSQRLEQQRAIYGSRLFVLHYLQDISPEQIAAAHRHWGKTYVEQTEDGVHTNLPDPSKRLKVGYVSPDFRIHAVVFFIQPVLAAHTPAVEVYCYANVEQPDEVTEQLKESHPVVWRDIRGMSDQDAEALIRQDGIDILVDLAGHSGGNRLTLFARKPAPVQITWIGYPDTTGLETIDYRITDGIADPPGMTESFHTEQLLRLPDSFLCYRPGGDFPVQSPLPRIRNGVITFGTYSNFSKITSFMLQLWADILNRVPNSRFVIKIRGLTAATMQQKVTEPLAGYGVDPARVTLLTFTDSVVNHLEEYSRIDIALDTFPYCGTTTTCEALYMGVPVITLAGRHHVARVGASLLTVVGLPELIAQTEEQYVEKAVELAGNLKKLLELRKGLRQQVERSPLCDNQRFVGNLETAYRTVWERWCLGRLAGGSATLLQQ